MPDPTTLWLFAVACVALFLVPGPVVLYVVARSAADGRASGLASVAGVHLASLVHVAAAVVGISRLLAASAEAFTVVKLAGAAYLVFLGVQALLDRSPTVVATDQRRGRRRVFLDGFVVNLLNPKTALFFLAFVPQFVDAGSPATSQIVVLGAVFVALGLGCDGAYALLGDQIGRRFRTRPGWVVRQRRAAGAAYLALGLVAATAGRPGD